MTSTGRFTLCNGFYGRMEVMEFLSSPHVREPLSALGFWALLGSYHATYSDIDWIPHGARRMCGGKPRDVRALVAHGFLLEMGGRRWQLGHEGDLWWIEYSRSGNRAPISPEVRATVFERDGMACVFCGETEDLTLDHIQPWSHGGRDTIANLRVLCRSCNSSRGNRMEAH